MSRYTRAASSVLDTLWQDDDFRQYFYDLDAELADLGPLVQVVFEPAYLRLKTEMDPNALQMLESQVTTDLMAPLHRRPGFRAMWEQWDSQTRQDFIDEQTELQLAKLLIQVYDRQLDAAYRAAYANYLAQQETHHRKDF